MVRHRHDLRGRARHGSPAGQADLIEAILLALADEWRPAYHDHQAGDARELIAWLRIAGQRYTRCVDGARQLGCSHWMPIVALAESAITGSGSTFQ